MHAPAQPAGSVMTPRRLVLGLDGTWNSDFDEQRRDQGQAVLKPTNVLKLCRAVLPWDKISCREQITSYQIGVGSLTRYPSFANRLLFTTDRILGGANGAGFEANIETALSFLVLNYRPGDEIFLFGFSRGAATARGLTRFLDWTGGLLPCKDDAYYLPIFFHTFVVSEAKKSFTDAVREINDERAGEKRPPLDLTSFHQVTIEFLGVWDTVIALGFPLRFGATGAEAGGGSFYIEKHPARCVKHARQALAIDEKRYNFRPEIWSEQLTDQSLAQRWFAGVHSNVGGGYVHDGLANLAFRWMLKEASARGLVVDDGFVSHFGGYPFDQLYDSDSLAYRIMDGLFRRAGKRQLTGTAMNLDRSVIQRIQASPDKLKTSGGQPYRPQNVLLYLASLPDLAKYLAELGVPTTLPSDVMADIAALRQATAQAAAKP